MIGESFDLSKLPDNLEEAFCMYQKAMRKEMLDRLDSVQIPWERTSVDYSNGYVHEKQYVAAILAFVDEYGMDLDLPNILNEYGDNFEVSFGEFESKINYLVTRFGLRVKRQGFLPTASFVYIGENYKKEIGTLLNTIRGIVEQKVDSQNKREAIYIKMASLQSEIDRDRTTLDMLFDRAKDFTSTVSECAGDIEPVVKKLEKFRELIFKGVTKKQKSLSVPEQAKQIEDMSNTEEDAA
ncbi:MAG: hypothetical protein VX730_02805 [Pseudomonadota bacterium]|nr:hypothetical protein [Pseudomonadota bacterium]